MLPKWEAHGLPRTNRTIEQLRPQDGWMQCQPLKLQASHGRKKIAPLSIPNRMDCLHPIKESPTSYAEGWNFDCDDVLQVGFEVEMVPHCAQASSNALKTLSRIVSPLKSVPCLVECYQWPLNKVLNQKFLTLAFDCVYRAYNFSFFFFLFNFSFYLFFLPLQGIG
jgi:hypothetical protein